MPSLPRWRRLLHWNRRSALLQKMSALSLHAFANLKRMQRASPVVPTRQDLGIFSGPGSSCDNRNTRRRLDMISSPEDEHARSAV